MSFLDNFLLGSNVSQVLLLLNKDESLCIKIKHKQLGKT